MVNRRSVPFVPSWTHIRLRAESGGAIGWPGSALAQMIERRATIRQQKWHTWILILNTTDQLAGRVLATITIGGPVFPYGPLTSHLPSDLTLLCDGYPGHQMEKQYSEVVEQIFAATVRYCFLLCIGVRRRIEIRASLSDQKSLGAWFCLLLIPPYCRKLSPGRTSI